MSLSTAIAAIQATAGAITGIKAAPTSPPESASVFPFAVSYAKSGTETPQSAGWAIGLHTIVCEIHVARQVLPKDIALALPFYELFRSAILSDPTIAGTVATVNVIRYEFGRLEYGNKQTIGYRFEIDVKLTSTY